MSISRKITIWTISLIFGLGLLSSYFYYRMQLREETERLELLAGAVVPVIEESLYSYMLSKDIKILDRTFNKLKNIKPIGTLWLIDREGVIKASTDKQEVGTRLSPDDAECRPCHHKGQKGLLLEGRKIFRWVQPVANMPQCHKCHDPLLKYNGVIIADFSLEESERHLKKDIMMGLLIFIPSLLTVGFGLLFLSIKVVVERLDHVINTVKRFRNGDYSARAPVDGKDEITRLEDGFNEMAETVNNTEEEIRRHNDTQSAINTLLRISLRNLPLEQILEQALDLILSIPWLSLESRGAIFLVEDGQDKLLMKAQKGLSEYVQKECREVPFGRCLCGRAASTQELQFASELDDRHEIRYEGITPHGHYCIPVRLSGKTLGVVTMYLKEGHRREEKEVEFLNAIANALAGIIERKALETEREKHVLELQNALLKVSRSQKEWQETFDAITDLVTILDRDHRIIRANRAFAEYFGLQIKDVINKTCHEIFHALHSPIKGCPFKQALDNRQSLSCEVSDDKSKKTFQISVFPYYSSRREIQGMVHIARDITEQKENEMSLIMSERLASLGQMASGIVHEINNPLASIAGCAEGLLSRVQKGRIDVGLFENYLKIIMEEIIRCKDITTSVLSFARKPAYESKDMDINSLLDKTLELIGFQGRLTDIQMIRNYAQNLPPVLGSEGEIRQVFLIILTNALDAMKDKGALTVETGLIPTKGGGVFIKIRDMGPSIPREISERMFDPFFTTKSERGGTGLGLSIANKIILNHNGSLEFTSEEGKGTAFRISLPAHGHNVEL